MQSTRNVQEASGPKQTKPDLVSIATSTAPSQQSDRQRLDTLVFVVILSVTAFGSLMTIVTVALGDIAEDLNSSRSTMTWAITGLMLTMAVATPIGGKLGDLYGYRKVFLVGLAGGTVATLLAALARDAPTLIAFRVLFGAFGALVLPNAQALMMHAFGPSRRSTALGWFNFAMTGAPTVGIVIGGPMIDVVGWRPVFAAFATINLLALIAGALLVRPVPGQGKVSIDFAGAATLALTVLSGLFAITRFTGQARDGSIGSALLDVPALSLVVAAVCAGRLFVYVERRSAQPMLKIDYFARRAFTMPMIASASLQFAYMGGFVVTPALLTDHYGWTAGGIALLMIPRPGAFSLSSLVGGYLPQRIGMRGPIIIGAVVMTLSMLTFAWAATSSHGLGLVLIVIGLILTGIAAGISGPSTGAMVADAVDDNDLGIANGMNQQVMFIGIVAGIQTMNVLIGDDAPISRFVFTYGLGAGVAIAGVAAGLLAPRSHGESSNTE